MRLFDERNDQALEEFTLYLERQEAEQLVSYIEQLLADPSIHHIHLSSPDYQRELTVTIYDVNNADHLETFDVRSRRLILDDE